MKKVTKVVTLAATALCAFGVVGAISATLAKAPKAEAAAVQMYTIKVVCDSKITYECNKVIAKEGDRVDLALTYNHRNYAVDSVSIGNDEYAAMIDDKTFYFAMPAKDVTVVVNSRALNEDTGLVDIINDNEEEGLFLNGCPAMAMPGDCVSFTVTMAADSPYRFTGYVEIYDGEEELIDFDENNGVFTFIVPETGAEVYCMTEERSYFLSFDKPELVNSVTYEYEGSFISGKYEAEADEEGRAYIPYTSQVTVEFADSYLEIVDGVEFKEQKVEFDGTKKVTFEMPAKDIELKVVTEKFYRPISLAGNIFAEDYGINSLDNHYDWAFMRSATSSGEYEAFDPSLAVYGDYVRAYYTPKAEYADKTIYGVTGLAVNANGDLYGVSLTKGSDTNGNYLQFSVSASYVAYFISVDSELTPFAEGHEAVGTYSAINIYQSGAKSNATMSTKIYVNQEGTIKTRASKTYAVVPNAQTVSSGDGMFEYQYNSQYRAKVFYGNGILITGYDDGYGADEYQDWEVGYKAPSGKTPRIYSLHIGKSFSAFQVTVDSVVVANAFIVGNGNTGNAYGLVNFYATGVEFEFTTGTNVGSTSAKYNVKVNGTVIGSVNGTTYTPAA